jgi:PTH1 family peptidyl-tRNA hydrolase
MEKIIINKLYVCLGNIGKEYENTRHNAGFLFGEAYIQYLKNINSNPQTKEHKDYTLISFKENNTLFLFPKTLMNLSGRALVEFLAYTNIITHIIIVHDDLDLLLGEYKINRLKGPKNHNGLISIEEALQTKDFTRIRIGIENRNELKISGLDYVLYKFTPEELIIIDKTINKIISEITTS